MNFRKILIVGFLSLVGFGGYSNAMEQVKIKKVLNLFSANKSNILMRTESVSSEWKILFDTLVGDINHLFSITHYPSGPEFFNVYTIGRMLGAIEDHMGFYWNASDQCVCKLPDTEFEKKLFTDIATLVCELKSRLGLII